MAQNQMYSMAQKVGVNLPKDLLQCPTTCASLANNAHANVAIRKVKNPKLRGTQMCDMISDGQKNTS